MMRPVLAIGAMLLAGSDAPGAAGQCLLRIAG